MLVTPMEVMVVRTLDRRTNFVWPVTKARQELFYLDTPSELSSEQVAFVQEKDELRFGQELGRAYRSP